jgi:ubiquinone/menaquinone biosynthesis C-methylase UbiE
MEARLEKIREQQKEIWNRFSPGWKKWDDMTMSFLEPMGDAIINLIKPGGVDFILDVASGTGEPALTIASMLNGGIVIATDLAEGMLKIASEKASLRKIKNLRTVACDISNLPFPDNQFDSISCRFGFMFFPDMLIAAKEMMRVLKPGGRIATTVWNVPEKNFWITAIMSSINKNIVIPPAPSEAPGIFRCAKSGFIGNLFKKAGLKNISEQELGGKMDFGSPEVYWNYMTEVVAPVATALSNASNKVKENIKSEVLESINQRYPDGKITIDSNALLIYGEK